MKLKYITLGLFFLVSSASCSGTGTTVSSSSSLIPETDYVTAAEEVAPAFTSPISGSVNAGRISELMAVDEQWGYRAFEIAVLMAKDDISIGNGNIFYNITTAQNIFDEFKGMPDLDEYAFSDAFTEPFFGVEYAYDYAANFTGSSEAGATAISESDDGTVSVLSTFSREAGTENGHEAGALKASYNETGKTLTMDVVGFVDYDTDVYLGSNSGQFIMRMQLEGNAESHVFDSLKLIKTNPGAGEGGTDGYYLNIVGKGVSQGDGAYFLFRITDQNGSDAMTSTDGYFCVDASNLTSAADFDTPKTEQEMESTDCADYLTDVKAMTALDAATDLPSEAFDISIPGNPKVFVMEFNPIPSP